MENDKKPEDLFSKAGLSVEYTSVEVGQTYPIYGVITEFIKESPGNVLVRINQNIEMNMKIEDQEKIDLLKNRAFEFGIFVCEIKETGDVVKGDCTTVVFGKRTDAMVQ
jgi:hypothetical protein